MTAFLLVDFYTILFPDSFRRSFRMVWEILPTRGLQDWYAGIFGSIHPSYHLMSNLYNCNEEWFLCLEVFYWRKVILQCRGVAGPQQVSDKQMDPVDRNLPIGSFRFSWGNLPVVFFLKSQVVVGYYVDWLSADLHQDSWESWECWGQIWFSSWASIKNWTNWICQVDKVWVVDRARKNVLFLYMFVGLKKSQSSRLFVGLVFFELVEVYRTGRQEGFCPAGLPPTAPMVAFGEEFDVAKIIPSLQRLQWFLAIKNHCNHSTLLREDSSATWFSAGLMEDWLQICHITSLSS